MTMQALTAMIRLPNKIVAMFKKRRPTLAVSKKRRPTLAVIDDTCFIRSIIVKQFSDEYDVTEFARIPTVLDELAGFDVLIVDGNGIGNNAWKHGADFLCDYAPKHPEKRFVHFTGLCTDENWERLKAIGVTVVSKGSRPEKLVNAVNGKAKDDGDDA